MTASASPHPAWSQPKWSLRLARPEDAEFLPAIEQSAAQLFKADPQLAHLANAEVITQERHRILIGKGRCLVALHDNRIAGFLSAISVGREIHILELSVHADCQRMGMGSGLVRAAIVDARNSGFQALTLTTFSDVEWNAPFYAALGFVAVEDLSAHPRLAELLVKETATALQAGPHGSQPPTAQAEPAPGRPTPHRIAMIRFIAG